MNINLNEFIWGGWSRSKKTFSTEIGVIEVAHRGVVYKIPGTKTIQDGKLTTYHPVEATYLMERLQEILDRE